MSENVVSSIFFVSNKMIGWLELTVSWLDGEETIELQCQSVISTDSSNKVNKNNNVVLKEMKITKTVKRTRNSSKIRPFGLWEKYLNSEKFFVQKQWTHVPLSPLCYFANLFTQTRCLILSGDGGHTWYLSCS